MNDLLKRLTKKQPVQANRPDLSSKALKERIDVNYVHIHFQETGTELGMHLDRQRCALQNADFEQGSGSVHLEGALTLNYEKVRCTADVDLSTMLGSGYLSPITDENEYKKIVATQ